MSDTYGDRLMRMCPAELLAEYATRISEQPPGSEDIGPRTEQVRGELLSRMGRPPAAVWAVTWRHEDMSPGSASIVLRTPFRIDAEDERERLLALHDAGGCTRDRDCSVGIVSAIRRIADIERDVITGRL